MANGVSAPSALWRNRDFMILWTGQTVSTLGSSMSFFVFPLVGYSLSHSTTQAALAGSAYTLGAVAARLPAGALVDRWNRRAVLLGSNGLGALLYGSLVVALALGGLTLAQLVAVALLTGVVGSFYSPAETSAVKTVVPRKQLPTAFSQNQARQHVGALVGPPLGGALYTLARSLPFLVDAVSYAASALAVAWIRTPLPAPEPDPTAASSMRRDIAEGIRFLWSRGFLRAIVGFAALANFGANLLFLVLTLKLLRAGVAPAAIGLIDTIAAVAGLAGSVLAPLLIKRVPSGLLAIGTGTLLVAAVLPIAFTDNVPVIGALLAVALLGNPAGNACISSYMVATIPDRLQGRTNAALMFSVNLLAPLGPLLGGFLLAAWGGEQAMLAAGGVLVLSLLPLVLSGDVRRLPTPDRWPTPDETAPAEAAPDEGGVEPVGILEG
ncbi:MAG: MFS transporter [Nocardioidaceae bacterium]